MILINRGRVMAAYVENLGRKDSYKAKFEALVKAVDEAPAVDAVPVVRCKDCKHRGDFSRCPMAHIGSGDPPYDENEDYTIDDGFCNYGEKKDG